MENQNKSMSKAGLLGLSLVDHRQHVSRLKHFQWIFLTIKTKPKCITKFFKVLHDLTPSYLLKQQKSPLLTSNSTLSHMNFFQSLNTPCHFLPPGLCSRCSALGTPLNTPSLSCPMTWLVLAGPSDLNLASPPPESLL